MFFFRFMRFLFEDAFNQGRAVCDYSKLLKMLTPKFFCSKMRKETVVSLKMIVMKMKCKKIKIPSVFSNS